MKLDEWSNSICQKLLRKVLAAGDGYKQDIS